MASPRSWREAAPELLLVTSALIVYVRYQRTVSPEPIVLMLVGAAWATLFLLACAGAGGWLQRFAPREIAELPFVVVTVAGAGVLALTAFVLGQLHMLFRPLLAAILIGAALAGIRVLRERYRPADASRPESLLPVLFAAVAVALTFLAALTPSAFYDQLNYHLAFPFHWLRHHTMIVFPHHDYSFLPANIGLLYSYALAFLPAWAAQLVHWSMAVLCGAAVWTMAAEVSEGGGAWGSAIFITTPAVAVTATVAASGLGAAAFAAAAWTLVTVWLARSAPPLPARWWLLCGALLGLAVGSKVLTGITAAVPVAVVLLWPLAEERFAPAVRRTALVTVGAVAAFAPWMIRNGLLKGNPLYPLFSSSKGVTAALTVSPGGEGIGRWLAHHGGALLLGTFSPHEGIVGPLYLVLLPAAALVLLSQSRLSRRLLAGLLVGVAGWSLLPHYGRYLLAPLLLAAAVAGGGAAAILRQWHGVARASLLALLGLGFGWNLVAALPATIATRVGCTIGSYDTATWVGQLDYWKAAQFINDKLPADAKVLLVAESRSMYIDRDIIVEDPFQKPLLTELAVSCPSARAMADELRRRGVTHVLLNWNEAHRIAALTHRSSYFDAPNPKVENRIQRFLASELRPLLVDGQVEVAALAPSGPPDQRNGT